MSGENGEAATRIVRTVNNWIKVRSHPHPLIRALLDSD